MNASIRTVLATLALAFAIGACGPGIGPNSPLVGGTCTANNQCQDQCIEGDNHYPGGYCTVHCNNDAMCPGGTVCINDHGGMCAIPCVDNRDCAEFGRGFVCDARDRQGAPGGTLVCRVP